MDKNPNFFIHYELDESGSVDLESFGKSIIGFNSLLKEIFEISKIDADLEIRAIQPKKGSIIVQLLLEVGIHHQFIFNNLPDLQHFVQVIDPELLKFANTYFTEVGYTKENELGFWQRILDGETNFQVTVNNFENKRGAEFTVISAILMYTTGKFFLWSFQKLKNIKNKSVPDNSIPKEYFPRLKQIVKKTKKALKPIREGSISQIGFSLDGKNSNIDRDSIIDSKNLGEFLPDDEEILSEYKNGIEYEFTGEIRNFQSSRGDFMKIQIKTEKGKTLLTAKPSDRHTTEEFIQFYKKQVKFKAEVLRESLYQIPKIKVISGSMELIQKNIF